MKFIDLYEMPMMIDHLKWLDFEHKDKNTVLYGNFSRDQYKKVYEQLTNEAIVYRKRTELFCLDKEFKHISYYMKYAVDSNKVLGQYLWQSLVWSNGQPYLIGYPQKVFFEYLLPKFGVIVTDSEQSWNGKRFWERMLIQAFDKNLNVYYYDFTSRFISKLNDHKDILRYQYQYDIWSPAPLSKKKRLVISNRDLMPNS